LVDPGDLVDYEITVSNLGNCVLEDVKVTDVFDSEFVRMLELKVGESKTVAFDWQVPWDALGGSVWTNVANAEYHLEYEGKIDDLAGDSVVKVVVRNLIDFDIDLSLLDPNQKIVGLGEVVRYVVSVENKSNVSLVDVELEDSLVSGWVKTIPLLGIGESISEELEYTVGLDVPGLTVIENLATGRISYQKNPKNDYVGDPNVGGSAVHPSDQEGFLIHDDPENVLVNMSRGVTLDMKIVGESRTSRPGDNVTFSIVVKNVGNTPLYNLVVTSSLDPQFSQRISGMEIGESKTVQYVYPVPANASGDETLVNVAKVSVGPDSVTDIGENPRDLLGNIDEQLTATSSVSFVVGGEDKYWVEKTLVGSSGLKVNPGDEIRFSITAFNDGTGELKDIKLTDVMDPGWVKNFSLLSGESVVYEFGYVVPERVVGTSFVNTVVMEPFGKPAVRADCEVLVNKDLPKIVVNKTVDSDQSSSVSVGDEVDYLIQVRNIGSVPAKDIVVTDSLDDGWSKSIDVLAPGESKGFNFSVVIEPSMVRNGKVVNTAIALTEGGVGSNVVESEGSETVLVEGFVGDYGWSNDADAWGGVWGSAASTGIGLEKRLAVGQPVSVEVGNRVVWDIIVTNRGSVDATNVVVKDGLDLNWSETISLLKPGEVWSFQFEYVVSPGNLGDRIDNVASATWTESGGAVGSSVSNVSSVTIIGGPGGGPGPNGFMGGTDGILSVDKRLRAGQNYRVKYGSVVSYDISVSNVVGSVLSDIVVTDSLDSTWRETVAELNPGESKSFLFEYVLPKYGIRNGETISNVVYASAAELSNASGSVVSISDVLTDDVLFDLMYDEVPQGAAGDLNSDYGFGVSLPKTSDSVGFLGLSFAVSFLVVGTLYLICSRKGLFLIFE
jgi:uncharacterized repeat protein (TIGR01451 family)